MRGRDNPSLPEGSFIVPSEQRRRGMFLCAMCMGAELRMDYEPHKHVLTISCDRCGNARQVNFMLEGETLNER